MNKIKVLIIEPSINYRTRLKEELSKDTNIQLQITGDLKEGRDSLVYNAPDVLVISKNIKGIAILEFLKRVFKYKLIPTIVTGDFSKEKDLALDLIDLGVLDVVSHREEDFLKPLLMKNMTKKILATSFIHLKKSQVETHTKKLIDSELLSKTYNRSKVIAIGASTGGPIALREIITNLPEGMPPILVAQHMPKAFITSFALHLDKSSKLKIVEGKDGEQIKAGTVYIAPGGVHMEVRRRGANYYIHLSTGDPVHYQRPAVEVLFNSVAKYIGRNAIGVILTGMGRDGALGLLNMKKHGAYTIGQDERSSIVYGMPKEAFEIGAVKKQLPLEKIPMYLFKLTRR